MGKRRLSDAAENRPVAEVLTANHPLVASPYIARRPPKAFIATVSPCRKRNGKTFWLFIEIAVDCFNRPTTQTTTPNINYHLSKPSHTLTNWLISRAPTRHQSVHHCPPDPADRSPPPSRLPPLPCHPHCELNAHRVSPPFPILTQTMVLEMTMMFLRTMQFLFDQDRNLQIMRLSILSRVMITMTNTVDPYINPLCQQQPSSTGPQPPPDEESTRKLIAIIEASVVSGEKSRRNVFKPQHRGLLSSKRGRTGKGITRGASVGFEWIYLMRRRRRRNWIVLLQQRKNLPLFLHSHIHYHLRSGRRRPERN